MFIYYPAKTFSSSAPNMTDRCRPALDDPTTIQRDFYTPYKHTKHETVLFNITLSKYI